MAGILYLIDGFFVLGGVEIKVGEASPDTLTIHAVVFIFDAVEVF